jgi:hypothetical protein
MQTFPIKTKRYQECSWIHRRWRDRWYLLVPFSFLKMYIIHQLLNNPAEWELDESIEQFYWSLAVSFAQIKMNYYYTMEEVRESVLGRIYEKNKDSV